MAVRRVPLFALSQVLFPNMVLSLHIFEPRYQQMINRCIDQDLPFGVVLIHHGREVGGPAVPFEIGTMARITDVERLPGGQINVVTVGVNRFRLEGVSYDEPYLVGDIEFLGEGEVDDRRAPALARQVTALFSRYLELYAELSTDDREEDQDEEDGEGDGDSGAGETDLSMAKAMDEVEQALAEALEQPLQEDLSPVDDTAGPEPGLLSDRPALPKHPGALAYAVAASAGWRQRDKQDLLEKATAAERLRAEAGLLRRDIASMLGLRRRREEGGRPPFFGPCSAN